MRVLIACLILIPAAARAGGLSGGGDICAIRPDLCDDDGTSVAALARQARRQPAKRVARRQPAAVGRAATASTRSITCRPAQIEVTPNNASLPVCGSSSRAPASDNAASVASASVDFNSYMNANAANPALARRSRDYQSAFASTAKAATFVAPNLDGGSGVREGAESAPAARAN